MQFNTFQLETISENHPAHNCLVFKYFLYELYFNLIIAKTPSDSPWTEKSENRESGEHKDFTYAYNALDDFEKWVGKEHQQLPKFDHATLYTG